MSFFKSRPIDIKNNGLVNVVMCNMCVYYRQPNNCDKIKEQLAKMRCFMVIFIYVVLQFEIHKQFISPNSGEVACAYFSGTSLHSQHYF